MKKTLEGADLSGAGAPFEEALLDLVEKHPTRRILLFSLALRVRAEVIAPAVYVVWLFPECSRSWI
jgi:hypothetical protein